MPGYMQCMPGLYFSFLCLPLLVRVCFSAHFERHLGVDAVPGYMHCVPGLSVAVATLLGGTRLALARATTAEWALVPLTRRLGHLKAPKFDRVHHQLVLV